MHPRKLKHLTSTTQPGYDEPEVVNQPVDAEAERRRLNVLLCGDPNGLDYGAILDETGEDPNPTRQLEERELDD